MAILTKDTTKKRVIDLTGTECNAYFLMGVAQNMCNQLGWDNWVGILDEMKSGDYEHLIKTFDKYFGDFVDLER